MKLKNLGLLVLGAAMFAGCGTSYVWTSNVPQSARTVAVPVFINESDVTELGSVMTRQVLREFQREGTFAIRRAGDSAIEVQGVVKKAGGGMIAYDRHSGLRYSANEMTADVEISVIDKRNGKVLINNREFTARATYVSSQDQLTALRDTSGRLADDLARQVVDAVLNLNWKEQGK